MNPFKKFAAWYRARKAPAAPTELDALEQTLKQAHEYNMQLMSQLEADVKQLQADIAAGLGIDPSSIVPIEIPEGMDPAVFENFLLMPCSPTRH